MEVPISSILEAPPSHFTSSIDCMASTSVITFLSIIGYIFKIRNFFLISKSLAPSGLVLNIVALVTGSIWGKPTWGTWWAWDSRITSMLILSLFYLMYFQNILHILLNYSQTSFYFYIYYTSFPLM